MTRVPLGSKWKEAPLIVRLLRVLPSDDDELITCNVCGAAWYPHEGFPDDCKWCAKRNAATHDWILKPPASRGYGYATDDDLAKLGYNPAEDRRQDLERWRHDLELAVDSGLITQAEGETAWQSANPNQKPSTSSTGTPSTTTPTQTNNPSSKTSPSAAAGPPSPPPRRPANRRYSSPSRWTPQPPATPPST